MTFISKQTPPKPGRSLTGEYLPIGAQYIPLPIEDIPPLSILPGFGGVPLLRQWFFTFCEHLDHSVIMLLFPPALDQLEQREPPAGGGGQGPLLRGCQGQGWIFCRF